MDQYCSPVLRGKTDLSLSKGEGPKDAWRRRGRSWGSIFLYTHGLMEEGLPLNVCIRGWHIAPGYLTKLICVWVQGGLPWGRQYWPAESGALKWPAFLQIHLSICYCSAFRAVCRLTALNASFLWLTGPIVHAFFQVEHKPHFLLSSSFQQRFQQRFLTSAECPKATSLYSHHLR